MLSTAFASAMGSFQNQTSVASNQTMETSSSVIIDALNNGNE